MIKRRIKMGLGKIWGSAFMALLCGGGVSGEVLHAGSGVVSTAESTGFNANAREAYALEASQGSGDVFTAGAQISITGTMTLVGNNNHHLNDKVGFAIGNATALGYFSTAGNPPQASYSLYLATTVHADPEAAYTIAKAGQVDVHNERIDVAPQEGTVGFVINLLFPETFNNGVNGAHVYEYGFGIDYDGDGTYELIDFGTFTVFEHNRIRFGFVVVKGSGEEAVSLANDYGFEIRRGFVPLQRTFYEWRRDRLGGAPVGADLRFSGDALGGGVSNAERYALGSRLRMERGETLSFLWNPVATDVAWSLYTHQNAYEPFPAWTLLRTDSESVTRTPGTYWDRIDIEVDPLSERKAFFALRLHLTDNELFMPPMEEGGRWSLVGQARFVSNSRTLLPTSGHEFLRHHTGTSWSHSAAVRHFTDSLEAGTYRIRLDVGHDGSDRPFAQGDVNIGFLLHGQGWEHGSAVRDQINDFYQLPGIGFNLIQGTAPFSGWEEWVLEITVSPDSPAVGQRVYVGVHAQTRQSGNQASFDGLEIESFLAIDEQWSHFGAIQSVDQSGWLIPARGRRLHLHSPDSPWVDSALLHQERVVLSPGAYNIHVHVGADANSIKPVARDELIHLGFVERSAGVESTCEIKREIDAFASTAGVAILEQRGELSGGWETWQVQLLVAEDSPAVGMEVSFAFHVQGGNEANHIAVDFAEMETLRIETVSVSTELAEEGLFVERGMFGANLVYHSQRIDEHFVHAFLQCGIEVLRYPGGTICEAEFDFLESSGPDGDRPSLTDVISFCNEHDTELILVVPVKRFVDDVAAGVQYARDFVQAVNIDKLFGDIHVLYWSLGNEYYADPPGAPEISASQYMVLADEMAAGMVDVDPTIKPVVQFRRSRLNEAAQIRDYLQASSHQGHVRASLTHAYPWDDFLLIRDQIPLQLATGKELFGFDDLLVTEWNIGNNATGMKQANLLLLLFESLVRGGTTRATMWPLTWQFNGVRTVLADVYSGVLRPPGQAFAELSAKTKESRLIPSTVDSDAFHASAYMCETGSLTLFLTCFELPRSTPVRFDLGGFEVDHIEASRLSAADEMAHDPAHWHPAETVQMGGYLYVQANQLNPWEILRITFVP